MAILLTADRWAEIWASVNTDYPTYKGTDTQLARQGQEWYAELKKFSLGAVNFAWSEHRKSSERRPKLSQLLTLAQLHEKRERAAKNRAQAAQPEVDSNFCPCGCGGIRWARVLTDRDGTLLQYVDGSYITRDEIECKRVNHMRPPEGKTFRFGSDSRGVLVASSPL